MNCFTCFRRENSDNKQEEAKQVLKKYEHAADVETALLLYEYETSIFGLTQEKVTSLLDDIGYNIVTKERKCEGFKHFISTCITPFNALLGTLSIIIYVSGDNVGGSIILSMILLSVITSFIQERRSNNAVARLQRMVSSTATVYRLIKKEDINKYINLNEEEIKKN